MLQLTLIPLKSCTYTSVSFDVDISWSSNYIEEILSLEMNDSCEARWKPTQNQIDDLILPAYTEMVNKIVEYIAKFQFPPGYAADMLRDIPDALESSHPKTESDFMLLNSASLDQLKNKIRHF